MEAHVLPTRLPLLEPVMRTLVRDLLCSTAPSDSIHAAGWVRTRRDSKAFSFLEINDGSCAGNLQIIADVGIPGSEQLAKMSTGASVAVEGKLVPSQGGGQAWEVQATSIRLLGEAPDDFPLQKKGHSQEFLRSIFKNVDLKANNIVLGDDRG